MSSETAQAAPQTTNSSIMSTSGLAVLEEDFVRNAILLNADVLLRIYNPDVLRSRVAGLNLKLLITYNEQGYAAIVMYGVRPVIEGGCAPSIRQALDMLFEHTARELSRIFDDHWDRHHHILMPGGTRISSEHVAGQLPSALNQSGQQAGFVEGAGTETVGGDASDVFGATGKT